jgi:hypothetical protein
MIETATLRQTTVATVVRVLVVFASVAFLLAALLHLGARLPLGFAVLATDRIGPAAIVEGLAGLVFAVSAYAVFSRTTWAWPAVVNERRKGETMKRILAVLAMIVALSIPAAAQASSSGPPNSGGQCAKASTGNCASTGHLRG